MTLKMFETIETTYLFITSEHLEEGSSVIRIFALALFFGTYKVISLENHTDT